MPAGTLPVALLLDLVDCRGNAWTGHRRPERNMIMKWRDLLGKTWLRGRDLNPRPLGYEPMRDVQNSPNSGMFHVKHWCASLRVPAKIVLFCLCGTGLRLRKASPPGAKDVSRVPRGMDASTPTGLRGSVRLATPKVQLPSLYERPDSSRAPRPRPLRGLRRFNCWPSSRRLHKAQAGAMEVPALPQVVSRVPVDNRVFRIELEPPAYFIDDQEVDQSTFDRELNR